jgi:UPF0755 protein
LIGAIIYSVQRPFVGDLTAGLVEAIIDGPASDDSSSVQFTINAGESAGSIAQRLEREKLVKYSWGFSLLSRMLGADQDLEAGVYALRRNMTTAQVINELRQGRYAGAQATFPEGWRAAEMASLLSSRKLVAGDDFLNLVVNGSFRYDILSSRPAGASLEGYLFPDTYRIPPGTTPQALLEQMLQNFNTKFTPEMKQLAAARSLTIHQVVTLASIVEREAQSPDERPVIASVFFNRIKANMPLQADSTVQYVVADQKAKTAPVAEYWDKNLTRTDLATDSPYNTYTRKGLPPGPICNPGIATIKAVLEAPKTDYLYFVAKNDGTHVFAKTLEEHNANVAKYQSGQ